MAAPKVFSILQQSYIIIVSLGMKSHTPFQGRLHSLDVLRGFDMFFIIGGDALQLYLCWHFSGT